MTELNYHELVTGYYDNLNNNLRNFKGGPGFLETWVHDEDHNRSLLEILDLAHSHGVTGLKIHLPKDVVGTLNLDWLRKNASEYGSVELKGEDLTYSNVKDRSVVDEFGVVSPCYAAYLKQHTIWFEGPVENRGMSVLVSGGLSVVVDDQGIVKEAKHAGYVGAERALMDCFCNVVVGRSLQESAEHGVIRLESEMRDPNMPLKVKGLLTPENADPMFALPTKLVREIWHQYVKAEGITPQRNFWRDPVPAAWLELPYEDKMKQAQIRMTEGCRLMGLQVDVLVTKILNDTRLVLSYKQNPSMPDFGRHMIKLERWLRSQMHMEVELQLESIEDRNRREERTKRT